MSDHAKGPLEWRTHREVECDMQRFDIAWDEARAWKYDGDRLVHETGGFFSIVGFRAHSNNAELDGVCMPIIDQPEIGILGLVVWEGPSGLEVLLQAKAEPGNVGLVQLAPTVQATVSNYTRMHGGGPTPYLDLFLTDHADPVLADSLQSEHGTRFLGKYNRNATVLVTGDRPDPESDVWRWFSVRELLEALHAPFGVNTDARSALVASDWARLAGREPFSAHRGDGFGDELHRSFTAAETSGPLAALERMRATVELEIEPIPLGALPEWNHDGWQLEHATTDRFTVPMLRVAAPDREVVAWDQPLVRSVAPQSIDLLCQERDGVLHFWLRGSAEPGFSEKVQFGPSPGGAAGGGTVIVSCFQSDEGGRFDRTVVDYRVRRLSAEAELADDGCGVWVTLRELYGLTRVPGACTNELRSAVSLLLAWL